jgi:hypothetical protein
MQRLGEDYVPLVPTEKNDTIFQAIVADIHVLPRTSIDPVVLYYSQIASIAAMSEDIRSDAFRQMNVERRIRMYSDYIELKKEAIVLGEEAMLMIATYADGGRGAVEKLEQKRRKDRVQ